VRHYYYGDVLYWLHNLSAQVPYCWRIVFGALQMNDDDTDAGGDFFFDLMKVLIALFFFCLCVAVIGGIVWGLL
jgi:hypothetical protein